MKKICYYSAIILVGAMAGIFVTACDDDDNKEVSYDLRLSDTTLYFDGAGEQTQEIIVTTDSPNFEISGEDDWIFFVKGAGKITVYVDYNESSERSGQFTVSGWNTPTHTVYVEQEAGTPKEREDPEPEPEEDYLEVSTRVLSFTYEEASQQQITVNTNVANWTASAAHSWATVTQLNNTINVSVSDNGEEKMRETVITVRAGDADPIEIIVEQQALFVGAAFDDFLLGVWSAKATFEASYMGDDYWESIFTRVERDGTDYIRMSTVTNWTNSPDEAFFMEYRDDKFVIPNNTISGSYDGFGSFPGYFFQTLYDGNKNIIDTDYLEVQWISEESSFKLDGGSNVYLGLFLYGDFGDGIEFMTEWTEVVTSYEYTKISDVIPDLMSYSRAPHKVDPLVGTSITEAMRTKAQEALYKMSDR